MDSISGISHFDAVDYKYSFESENKKEFCRNTRLLICVLYFC